MTYEEIRDRYRPRVLKLFKRIRRRFVTEGLYPDNLPVEDFDEEYCWRLEVRRHKGMETYNDNDFAITFTILDSQGREGKEGYVAFTLDVIEYGGLILSGMCPGNYTEDLWIPLTDEKSIERRFSLFELANYSRIAEV